MWPLGRGPDLARSFKEGQWSACAPRILVRVQFSLQRGRSTLLMRYVYLVYEDDYGGTFSPKWLTRVFAEDQEEACRAYVKPMGWLASVIKAPYEGTLDPKAYKQSLGGMFNDD